MRFLNRLISLTAVLMIAACGGGGGSAGDPPFPGDPGSGTGPTPSAADIVLTMSATSVANNGTETAVATATAIDANRNVVSGVPVQITVDSNAIVTPSGSETDAEGKVDATIGIGSDHTNRTITVTAKSGSVTRTTTLQVVDSAGGGGTAPSDLLLNLTSATIPNDGSQTVTANVTALDARRNVLPGVAVSVSVDQGATVQPSGTTTGTNGVLSAAVGTGGNRTNRTITVTATAGGLVRTAQLAVVDSPISQVPEAADLTLTLSASSLTNGGTSTLTATATAVDSRRNAVAGIPISYTVDGNAIITPSGTVTNTNGVLTAQVGIGADRKNRVVTVTANSGTLTRSVSFSVIGAKLTASFSPVVEVNSTANQVEYKLVDTNALPMTGEPISVTAAGLPSASGTTDENGKFVYIYTAPSAPTTLTIAATAGGDTLAESVTVASGSSVPPASQMPISASLTPTPSVISVNTAGSTTNQVELRALFLGANNQPVKNIRVRFDLAGNANNTDGTATQQGTYAYSDSTGVARGTITPGIVASPTNGVTVRACYDTNDFATGTCPNSVTNTLTVASEALSVNIRTDNTVDPQGAGGLTYIKKFVVMVVDAAGQAKADVLITPSVDLPSYYKGFYVWEGDKWVQVLTLASTENYRYDTGLSAWQQLGATNQPSCPNEDANRNGVREAPVYPGSLPGLSGRQEDLNWNGELDPRKADVAIKMVGSPRTDANGVAVVQIEYAKNLASWVDFVITVTASGIAGTEARAKYSGLLYGVGNLPFLSDDITDETVMPPFVVSPYGRGSLSNTNPPVATGVCTDAN
jgi:hypothetical protein